MISSREVRKLILTHAKRTASGHIGSSLCVADIIATLYSGTMRISDPSDPDRDRFILSKGHAALALYATLHLRGWLTDAELNSYLADGSYLGVHPEHELPGVEFSTGSLGHGISLGVGAALAARLQRSNRRVFVLLSDGECNEGSVWESAMSASHHRLSNLIAFIDMNGQQCFGYTKDVLNMEPMAEKWRSFGWNVIDIDGHDRSAIENNVAALKLEGGKPHMFIARTTFGKGVTFMHDLIKWHYAPMSDAEFATAMDEVERSP